MHERGVATKIRRASIAAVALATSLAAAPAAAQAPPAVDADTKARIDKLYDEAVAALDEKKVDIACPKLEEVTRLAPEAVGARITLGECYEAAGKLASAWTQYVAAEAMATNAGQAARVKKAAARATELKPKLATLTLEVPDAVRKIPGLVISRDGSPMVEAQWGTPLPIDKGAHTIVASAPGRVTWTGQIEIAKDGEAKTMPLPPLDEAPSGTMTATPTVPAAPSEASRSKVPAFVMGGVGVAGLVAGGALVGVAVGKGGELRDSTPKGSDGKPICGRTATAGEDPKCAGIRSDAASASSMGNAGIGVLVGGGVLVAAAAVYLLIPSKKPADSKSSRLVPVVGREGGGLVWLGSF